ncbi:uncharacterized protein LOC130812868 [Amaranthus tricolor]|uniref:uncharacterized protein LOC130812868 n=1 Tax=Amaranthus tricolor TaxID=29722 RepID=UPI002586DC14|nr:uncharacterized protein LOC130812868 [Amaranthus tricolor]
MSDDIEAVTSNTSCYYRVLGLCKQATSHDIRRAYRRLALKWHPDRWIKNPNSALAGEAKLRFQQVHEAYSVLLDKGKRSVYDAGLFDLLSDDDDENFTSFMQDMAATIKRTRCKEGYSLEELQEMLFEMVTGYDSNLHFPRKKTRTS